MKLKNVTAVIEASATGFGVHSDELPGITGYGDTIEEAKNDLLDSINDVLESHAEDKTMPPDFLHEGKLAFEYKYDIASIFKHFGMLDATGLAKKIGMNPSLLRQYKGGQALASDKQKRKIEEGLHRLGQELLNVRL